MSIATFTLFLHMMRRSTKMRIMNNVDLTEKTSYETQYLVRNLSKRDRTKYHKPTIGGKCLVLKSNEHHDNHYHRNSNHQIGNSSFLSLSPLRPKEGACEWSYGPTLILEER